MDSFEIQRHITCHRSALFAKNLRCGGGNRNNRSKLRERNSVQLLKCPPYGAFDLGGRSNTQSCKYMQIHANTAVVLSLTAERVYVKRSFPSLKANQLSKTINSVMTGVLKARELVQALVELQRDEESTDFLRSLEESQRRDLASSFRLTK